MLFIICLLFTLSLAHEENRDDSVMWEYKDPRWDTKIPNWWEANFVPPSGPSEEKRREFWDKQGQEFLGRKIEKKFNKNKAKNLVIFIGDGMGLSTQMAARVYLGNEKTELSFEKFPYSGLSKTYCINYQVADSACTATAILTGVKNNFNVLSLTGDVSVRNCTAQRDNSTHIESIFKYAQDDDKMTGIVTNTRITHATPAAAYSKSSSRYWETNEGVPDGCDDIAHQLIHGDIGSKIDVVLGGGRRSFYSNTFVDENSERGSRTDKRNLIEEYKQKHNARGTKTSFVQNRDELLKLNVTETDKILGLFAQSHLQYRLLSDGLNQPSLTEMTAKALEKLKMNENGFILLVEGGRIDHGHHETRARLALEETVELHKAVEYVKKNTNEDDTLIVVTADHSHVFTVGGYPPRGRNILGVGDFSRHDSMWFFTLNYANGPGQGDHTNLKGGRQNPRGMNYMNPQFRQPATVPKVEETHAGEDVGVYASGPYAHIFSGVYEQSYIAHAMFYATCLGPDEYLKNDQCRGNSIKLKATASLLWMLFLVIFIDCYRRI